MNHVYGEIFLPKFDEEPRYWIIKHPSRILDIIDDIRRPVHEFTQLVAWS